MTGSAILSIVLKILLVVVIFFVWVLTLGTIYAKIDEAKKEILSIIAENKEEFKNDLKDHDNRVYGYYLDILDSIKKKKKKKDKVNFIDILDEDL